MRTTIDRDSVEYLHVPITAPDTTDLATIPIQVAVTAPRPIRPTTEWADATYDDTTAEARLLIGPLLTPGNRSVWVRATDSPEVPVFYAGDIAVT